MTTFAGWLNEQRKRQDAVGWFARYWRDLPETPRLSSPSSIASHLEDRESHPGQNRAGERLPWGFRDPEGGNYVRDAYDATLAEYREVRSQIVQSAAEGDGVAGDTPEGPPGPQGPAGEAVEAATAAGLAAAQRHAPPLASLGSEAVLVQIARDLELIKLALGIARDEDGGIVRFPPAAGITHPPADSARVQTADWPEPVITGTDWRTWFEQADLSAVPE